MSNRCTALILGLILVACCLPLAAQTYTLQQLTIPYVPNESVWAYGINNRGAIVGTFYDPRLQSRFHGVHGFKRDANGVFEPPIDCPTVYVYKCWETILRGLNENGVIVGYYKNYLHQGYAGFLLYKGTFVDSGPEIHGINNKGDFVGVTKISNGGHKTFDVGFARVNKVLVKLQCPYARRSDRFTTIPEGIAADGTVVGTCSQNGIPVGFIRGPAGQYQLLQIPGADSTHFNAINNVVHQIVGYYTTQGKTHGVVYDYLTDAVTTVDWPDPNTQGSYLTGINSHDVIVGYAIVLDAQGHGLPVFSFIGTPQ